MSAMTGSHDKSCQFLGSEIAMTGTLRRLSKGRKSTKNDRMERGCSTSRGVRSQIKQLIASAKETVLAKKERKDHIPTNEERFECVVSRWLVCLLRIDSESARGRRSL